MKITIKDVAQYVGVSTATVSLVVNNKPGVNTETRKKVCDAIKKLEYHPNQIARNLITQKSFTIGFIITNIDNPFYGKLVYHMQKTVDKTNYNLLLGISNDQVEKEKNVVESMISRGVDGIILVPTRDGEHDLEHLYTLKTLGIPFLFATSAYNGIQADCVMADLEQATYEITRHLLRNGEKKIYFITDKKTLLLSASRIKGYSKAFKEYGAVYNPEWIVETNPTVENGILITERILEYDKPDAMITVNALLSLGAMKCLKDHGISVPDEIEVASFDDLEYSALLYTPLTAVKQPIDEICRASVELLKRRMKGDNTAFITECMTTQIVFRDSTR